MIHEKDEEISAMAKDEVKRLEPELELSKRRLQILLLPRDPNDQKNVVLEVRAGAGGEEAALLSVNYSGSIKDSRSVRDGK